MSASLKRAGLLGSASRMALVAFSEGCAPKAGTRRVMLRNRANGASTIVRIIHKADGYVVLDPTSLAVEVAAR